MAPTLDATLGGENSNSYCDLVFATAYASNQSWGDTWAALTQAQQEVALINATKWLETLPYDGSRCSATQALAWPRSGVSCDGVAATCDIIPVRIRQAEVELAWQLSQNPNAIVGPPGGGGTAAGTYVSKNQLGDLVQEFSEYSSADSSCDNCGDPALISAFPWLEDWLACWLAGTFGSSKILLRVRS